MFALLRLLSLVALTVSIPTLPPRRASQVSISSLRGSLSRSRHSSESFIRTTSQISLSESLSRCTSFDVFHEISNKAPLLSDAFYNQYKFTGQILGAEGCGLVYEAACLQRNRPVAVKIGYYDSSDVNSSVFTEIAVWDAVKNRIIGIAENIKVGLEPTKNLFYIMIVYDGVVAKNYQDFLLANTLSVDVATNHLMDLSITLDTLHLSDVYHGNLRLEALLITSSQKLLLTDLSNAGFIPRSKNVSQALSTVFYRSPQSIAWSQNKLSGIDPVKTDTYALGIIYFIQLFDYRRFVEKFGMLDDGLESCMMLNEYILGFNWAGDEIDKNHRKLLKGMLHQDELERWRMRDVRKYILTMLEGPEKAMEVDKSFLTLLREGISSMFT